MSRAGALLLKDDPTIKIPEQRRHHHHKPKGPLFPQIDDHLFPPPKVSQRPASIRDNKSTASQKSLASEDESYCFSSSSSEESSYCSSDNEAPTKPQDKFTASIDLLFQKKPPEPTSASKGRSRHPSKLKGRKKRRHWQEALVISTSNLAYQIWKVVQIILNFSSTFQYTYYAALFDTLSTNEKHQFKLIDHFYTVIFLLDLIMQFFVEHHYTTSNVVERNLRKLALLYIKGDFYLDVITVTPFSFLLESWISRNVYRLLFLIQILRLRKGFQLLNYKQFANQLKNLQMTRVRNIIKKDGKRAHSQMEDSTKISQILLISKFLKAAQFILIILCTSYFTGMLWYIKCEMAMAGPNINFVQEFAIQSKENFDKAIVMTYYTFTSLSTVGLGDLHPLSDSERIVGAFILMFGVILTSFIMDLFSKMMIESRTLNESYEQSTKLNLFLGTIRRFNDNLSLPQKSIDRIEEYFGHRWQNYKKLALKTQEDIKLFDLLPAKIQKQIFTDYLFCSFLTTYSTLFKPSEILHRMEFINANSSVRFHGTAARPGDLEWKDECYQDFLFEVLNILEPKQIFRKVIQKQNTLVDEMVFIMKGDFELGYNHHSFMQQNRIVDLAAPRKSRMENQEKFRFPLSFSPGHPIGLFEMCFEVRSQFIYRVKNYSETLSVSKKAECFFIRKRNWKSLVNNRQHRKEILEDFKNRVLLGYIDKYYFPTRSHQQKQINIEHQKNQSTLLGVLILNTFKHKINNNKRSFISKRKATLSADQMPFHPTLFPTIAPPSIDRESLIDQLLENKLTQDECRFLNTEAGIKAKKEESLQDSFKELESRIENYAQNVQNLIEKQEALEVLLDTERKKNFELEQENDKLRKTLEAVVASPILLQQKSAPLLKLKSLEDMELGPLKSKESPPSGEQVQFYMQSAQEQLKLYEQSQSLKLTSFKFDSQLSPRSNVKRGSPHPPVAVPKPEMEEPFVDVGQDEIQVISDDSLRESEEPRSSAKLLGCFT